MKKNTILVCSLLSMLTAFGQVDNFVKDRSHDCGMDAQILANRLTQYQQADFLTSSPNLLVILMDFEDEPFDIEPSVVESFFNTRTLESHPESGGFKDYFDKNSYGKFTPNAVVAGWYRAKHTYDYYKNVLGRNVAPDSLYYEGLAAANIDSSIDLSIFDNDGDGIAEGIIVLTSKSITAQARFFKVVNYAGIEFQDFAMTTITKDDTNLGTIAHEYGHILGLPDLYLTDDPIGFYCIMSHAKGLIPGNFAAWSKYRLGWIDPVIIEEPVSQIEIPSSNTSPFSVLIHSDVYRDGRYFLIENRTQEGYDAYSDASLGRLPGSGLVIYHVDDSRANEWVRIMQADGRDDMRKWNLSDGEEGNVGDEGDLYPGSTNNRSFNINTNPNTRSFLGDDYGISIDNISDPGSSMYADITPIEKKGGTLRIQPDLINVFDESASGIPAIGTTTDSIWGGDTYNSQGFQKLYGLTYYYVGNYTYPEDQYNAQKVNLKLYRSFDANTETPVDLFYEGRLDVALPDVPEYVYGLELFISWRAMVWFDEPIEVPETFFAAYCPIHHEKSPLINNRIYKGNVRPETNLPPDYGSYLAYGADFPNFRKINRNYLTLHFYASDQVTTTIEPIRNEQNVWVFPNPTRDQLLIQSKEAKPMRGTMFNHLGQKVVEQKIDGATPSLNISSLTPGVYYLHIVDMKGEILIVEKIIKE